jgi:hypothetical protein
MGAALVRNRVRGGAPEPGRKRAERARAREPGARQCARRIFQLERPKEMAAVLGVEAQDFVERGARTFHASGQRARGCCPFDAQPASPVSVR